MTEMTSKAHAHAEIKDIDRLRNSGNIANTAGGRAAALTLMFDLIVPIGLFYGLRATGAGTYLALLAGALLPGLTTVVKLVRHHRLDRLGTLVIAMMLLGVGVSLITGSPQFLLAKEGWITGLWGAWFLISLRSRRPLAFIFSRQLLEGRRIPGPRAAASENPPATSWDGLWKSIPRFRRIWQVSTLIWGCALLIDAAIRVAMAYTLPIDMVPALSGALWPVTFIGLQAITGFYYYQAGLWRILRRYPTVAGT